MSPNLVRPHVLEFVVPYPNPTVRCHVQLYFTIVTEGEPPCAT